MKYRYTLEHTHFIDNTFTNKCWKIIKVNVYITGIFSINLYIYNTNMQCYNVCIYNTDIKQTV